MEKTLLIICGPTAVGKTNVAIQLAQKYDTNIISADSRQIYKELSIGTAKPSSKELALVKHYFINHISIHDAYSAGKYEEEAIELLDSLFRKQDVVVMAGGTNLYIQAICQGFDDIPNVDPAIRKNIIDEFEQYGLKFLQNEVKNVDFESYSTIDIQNPQRLMRILEVFRGSGKKVSDLKSNNKKSRDFRIIKIGLNCEREILYNRINDRVDNMIQDGLIDEVKNLLVYQELNALQTVGYKELVNHFEGQIPLVEAIELIKRNSRRYAKRQLTWLRKDEEIKWFGVGNNKEITEYLEESDIGFMESKRH